ncbi:YolD-like family protein [Lysinibacillus parviboronicapiens]|uniref:YolD-like family protein n=1 Tax=Lysinibacillus parviboronicapiens TaxID=436516 RepID=UPI000D389E80|nr:YolD-like family protein [Lysinibacillus parviboronicapiens]
MIRDRGTMKWTAMMLPEHVQLIREWKQEDFAEASRELTEWELEELQQTIDCAVCQHKIITLTVWEGSRYLQWTGTIASLNQDAQELILETNTKMKHIPLAYIHAARLEDDGCD